MKNIVIIGGGTGTFTLLAGLRKYPVNNTVIVSTADDGGSGGKLRYELGVIPPGDYRQCLIGLSYTEENMKKLFSYRFQSGSLKGHTAGNIIIAALEKVAGNIVEAINLAGKMLNVRGQVLPVTLNPTHLIAVLKNGKKIVGEHNIDDQDSSKQKAVSIKQLQLKPNVPANPKALEAIKQADVIVFGPGDIFTSILPNILVKGIKEVINKSSAKKILVTNLMTKFGQSDNFKASDFVKVLKKYLGGKIDIVLANNKKPLPADLKKYAKEKAKMVQVDMANLEKLKVKIISEDFLSSVKVKKQAGDVLKRSFLRHNSDKLAKIIYNLD